MASLKKKKLLALNSACYYENREDKKKEQRSTTKIPIFKIALRCWDLRNKMVSAKPSNRILYR